MVAVIFISPNVSLAATTAELQAQIQALLAQIAQLQAQMSQQQPQQWCYDFKYNLNAASRGKEISQLQTALEKEGLEIDASEKSNQIFDESTASAVSGFQEKYRDEILTPNKLKYATGFVGKSTRAKLNSLYGCGIIKPQPIPVPITTPVPVISTSTISPAISCSGLEMVWPTSRRELYSFGGDTCDGYRYLNNKEISPSCYNYQECINAYSSANCINIPSTQKQCSVSSAPFITSFSPTSAVSYGIGTKVRVYGNNFSNLDKVSFINTQGIYYYAEWSPISNTEIEIPLPTMPAGQYYISVSSPSGSTQSVQLFSIIATTTQPSITVFSPNGGEKLEVGQTYQIKWSTNNFSPTTAIQIALRDTRYDPNNSAGEQPIVSAMDNSGYYNWVIPQSVGNITVGAGNIYKIVIYGIGIAVSDESDNYFTIASATTSVNATLIGGDITNSKADNILLKIMMSNNSNTSIILNNFSTKWSSNYFATLKDIRITKSDGTIIAPILTAFDGSSQIIFPASNYTFTVGLGQYQILANSNFEIQIRAYIESYTPIAEAITIIADRLALNSDGSATATGFPIIHKIPSAYGSVTSTNQIANILESTQEILMNMAAFLKNR